MAQATLYQQHRFGAQDQRYTCKRDNKIAFTTLTQAQAHAEHISQRTGKRWSAYLGQCGWHHVTSKGEKIKMSIFTQEHYDALVGVIQQVVAEHRSLQVDDLIRLLQLDDNAFDIAGFRQACHIFCECDLGQSTCPQHQEMLDILWEYLSGDPRKWREPLGALQDAWNLPGIPYKNTSLWEDIRGSSTLAIEAMHKLVTEG